MNKKYGTILFLSLFVLLIFGFAELGARGFDYLLELTIVTDKQDEFDSFSELNERQFRDLRNNPRKEIEAYLVEARKKYADDIGYRKEIYGEENYRMVVIAKYRFVVRDKSSGRVLLQH